MTDVVLFHHVLGLTEGVRAFAERLAVDGCVVHTPDLYGGQVASSFEEGFAINGEIGDDAIRDRAERTLADLPKNLVYAGMSLGVMSTQLFAQTRANARGALLYEACVPVVGERAFGPWPRGVGVQIHGMDDDEFFAHEGDLDAARQLVDTVGADTAEVFTYPGNNHLFLDNSLTSYDPVATDLVVERSRAFLHRIG